MNPTLMGLIMGLVTSVVGALTPKTMLPPAPLSGAIPTVAAYAPPSAASQKWLVALGAILSRRNGETYEVLSSNLPKEELRELIGQSWDIYEHQSAIGALEWLKNEGHRAQFNQIRTTLVALASDDYEKYVAEKKRLLADMSGAEKQRQSFLLDFVWQHRSDLQEKSLIAWDYMRLVNVARWSYSAGYISEQEAWQYIVPAGKTLQQMYDSWETLADDYLLGRSFWQRDSRHPDMWPMVEWLKTNPTSPWKELNWKERL